MTTLTTTESAHLTLGLITDNGEWISIGKGSPLILTVAVYNSETDRAAGANATVARAIEKAEDLLNEGKITNEEFEKQAGDLNKGTVEPELISLGSKDHAWYESIKFFEYAEGGKLYPLNWPLTVMANPKPEPVVNLGAFGLALVSFGLDPEETQKLNPGKLTIVCRLDKATSNQVRVEIQSAPEEAKSKLPLANYFYRQEKYDKARELVEEELASFPSSIGARFLLGEIQEAQGDLELAMQSYLQALADFESKRTEATSEDPQVLLEKIQNLGYRVKRDSNP